MIRFTIRSSPTGARGLEPEGLTGAARWALHGFQMPEPCDGPCPEPPRASYDRGSLAQAGREHHVFGAQGLNTVGDAEVPLETVLAMARRRRDDKLHGPGWAPNQRDASEWDALIEAIEGEIVRRRDIDETGSDSRR